MTIDFEKVGQKKMKLKHKDSANKGAHYQDAVRILQQGLSDRGAQFRSGQWEAIDALINHQRRVLVVERTGWGKSMVYFIATKIRRSQGHGLTMIISPLLALMRNQVTAALKMQLRAASINSTNPNEWTPIENQIKRGKIDLLLVSPERFANERFLKNVLRAVSNKIGLLVIDEAHCISDWGHDFRPDYRRIVDLLKQLPPNLPVVGTTATANNRVIKDIQHQLGNVHIQRGPLTRDSLELQVIVLPDQASRMAWLSKHIPKFSGTGIVYVLTKRDANSLSDWLRSKGIDAHAYYSGVVHNHFDNSNEYRQHLENQLLHNKIKVLVATSALGMGYDKPDIEFVIHYQCPDSVITYYQQVGRAGRGLPQASGVLLSGKEDAEIIEYFRENAFPSEEIVDRLLNFLRSRDGATVSEIEQSLNLRRGKIGSVLKYLSVQTRSPIFKDGTKWYRTAVPFQLDKPTIKRLTKQREVEWEQMQAYIRTSSCRMAFLQKALNDPYHKGECHRCDNTRPQPRLGKEFDKHVVIEAQLFLRRSEFKIKPRKRIQNGASPQYGFQGNLSANMQASEGRVLSRWADAGWGSMVKDGKTKGYFNDELVDAMAEMIQRRWNPRPFPTWVTCIPSARNPDLVRSFSRRLAKKLGLSFSEVLSATGKSKPQKLQQNSFHQCNNLDGAFKISGRVLPSPVFLIDDIVDSGWTFTIAAALLGREGCQEVYPVALTSTANE